MMGNKNQPCFCASDLKHFTRELLHWVAKIILCGACDFQNELISASWGLPHDVALSVSTSCVWVRTTVIRKYLGLMILFDTNTPSICVRQPWYVVLSSSENVVSFSCSPQKFQLGQRSTKLKNLLGIIICHKPCWPLHMFISAYIWWCVLLPKMQCCGHRRACQSHTCAPVRVAISRMMSAERSLLAYTTPSESTSLPSASVLLISTVLCEKVSKTREGKKCISGHKFLNQKGSKKNKRLLKP